ncbi:hypothetical protein HGM15179_020876 [Zosterops borbonicus]|uniref:Ig-like domain-containing protein n=1 Tax=Zosterops borbonicus TaxID=364589 RepID=A0A8K1D6T5_9PASS|nr:hypothetical protein HGM15179_020876 [Zosterops borbonicus]
MTFHSNNTDGNGALWNFGNVPIVSVLFEDPPQCIFSKEEYKTHFTVSERGRALSISQLCMKDAGTYSVTIGEEKSTFILWVYKELTEPTVTCESQKCSGSICLLSLHCSMPGAGFGNISYTWRRWDWQWDEAYWVLVVDKSSWDNLTCTARNAVSSRSVTINTPEGLCPDAPSGNGVRIEVAVGVAVGVILFGFLIFCWKSQGYCPATAACTACTARVASDSSEISATDGPGHQVCLLAMNWLGPAPGLAWDKHGTESRRALSAPPETTDQLRPEPRLAMDQLGPEPGLTKDQLGPELELTMDQLGPEPGLTMDQSQD